MSGHGHLLPPPDCTGLLLRLRLLCAVAELGAIPPGNAPGETSWQQRRWVRLPGSLCKRTGLQVEVHPAESRCGGFRGGGFRYTPQQSCSAGILPSCLPCLPVSICLLPGGLACLRLFATCLPRPFPWVTPACHSHLPAIQPLLQPPHCRSSSHLIPLPGLHLRAWSPPAGREPPRLRFG
jgi:hypothetical protein